MLTMTRQDLDDCEKYDAIIRAIRDLAQGRDWLSLRDFDRCRPAGVPGAKELTSSAFGQVGWTEWLGMAGVAEKRRQSAAPPRCECGREIETGRIAQFLGFVAVIPMCAECACMWDEDEQH